MDGEESMDQQFLRKLEEVVKSNLNNQHFGVEDLEREVGLSRSQIHRKLRILVNKSITQFVRELRLDKAFKMLQKGLGTAAEISYRVGFNSPTYFNKCFHDYFGYPPGEVCRTHDNKTSAPLVANKKAGIIDSFLNQDSKHSIQKQQLLMGAVVVVLITILSTVIYFAYNNLINPKPVPLTSSATAVDKQITIVIIPFHNISKAENQYITRGTYFEVAKHLKKVRQLSVLSGSEVEKLSENFFTPLEIGNKLNAEYVIEGSVWKEDDKFKLSIAMTEVKTSKEIFAKDYHRDYKLLIELVDEVALSLVENLQVRLLPDEEMQVKDHTTNNITVYDLGLKAWDNYQVGVDNISLREQFFYQALQLAKQMMLLEPDYLDSYAIVASVMNMWENQDSVYQIGKMIVEKFPEAPSGYGIMGHVFKMKQQYDQSLEMYQKAIDLGSDNKRWTYQMLGLIHSRHKKDYQKGLGYIIESFNHYSPVFGYIKNYTMLHHPLQDVGLYDKALEFNKMGFTNTGGQWYAIKQIVDTRKVTGKFDEALDLLDSLCRISVYYDFSNYYGMVYLAQKNYEKAGDLVVTDYPYFEGVMNIQKGNQDEGERILRNYIQELLTRTPDTRLWHDQEYLLAECYAWLGDYENALSWLEKCGERGFWNGHHDYMMIDPAFDSIRADPRFQSIYKKAQKEKAEIRKGIMEMIERGELVL